MRTIVISDVHGWPALVENALEHAGFRPRVDRFIFAGDLLDGGPDSACALDLIEDLANVVLPGNHELAAMFGLSISPQDPGSRQYADLFVERLLDFGGHWRLAVAEQNVLVTHAGVSDAYASAWESAGRDVERFADALSSDLRVALGRLGVGTLESADELEPLLGLDGPLWWRPFWPGNSAPLEGVTQMCGHTPVESYTPGGIAALDLLGIHLIAPSTAWDEGRVARSYRYGVIENGKVRVVSGERDS